MSDPRSIWGLREPRGAPWWATDIASDAGTVWLFEFAWELVMILKPFKTF